MFYTQTSIKSESTIQVKRQMKYLQQKVIIDFMLEKFTKTYIANWIIHYYTTQIKRIYFLFDK